MNSDWILILGATSDIGIAIANRFAKEGYNVQLAARNVNRIDNERINICTRYNVLTTCHEFDVLNLSSHNQFIKTLPELPQIVVSVIGLLGDHNESQRDIFAASLVMRSNYEGPASILALFANHFEKRGSGTLIGVSSVAGDRGRASNYIYGSAKSGLTTFLSGLRNRLHKKGVHVITVKPGFVYSAMTKTINPPSLLTVSPKTFANRLYKCFVKRRNVIFINAIWLYIMFIIKKIPEFIFKRTSL
ncbi:MAG: short-chain dehydrogenase [Rhodospirillaceae bacterium]|nr:short-chain dehydrogenase [Rhodospirillaceae bacterium]